VADEEEHAKRLTWLTLGLPAGVAAILISLVVYAVGIGHDIGALRQEQQLTAQRLDALEQRGSGPVQQSAERVAQLQARVDRILSELLDTQKRLGEIATQQAREAEMLGQLREMAKQARP
jgi:hypothetical protein